MKPKTENGKKKKIEPAKKSAVANTNDTPILTFNIHHPLITPANG